MAQTEDTELRDLVIEALEKNGSLAKIRALLRANVFVAFEDECDNVKQNSTLENMLKIPEGILSLSIVHEFLEYCNLKNTLFVYMAESRQGKEYNAESKKILTEKLNLKNEAAREPILVTLIKLYSQKKQNYKENIKNTENSTYIDMHSSSTSNTQSDSSSDEKNKLQLRLQLNNSDTDTSNDSVKDKISSEYYPSEHIKQFNDENIIFSQHSSEPAQRKDDKNVGTVKNQIGNSMIYQNMKDLKVTNNSSDSTSYVDVKPFNVLDEKLMNTTGVPINEKVLSPKSNKEQIINESVKSITISSTSPASLNNDSSSKNSNKKSHQEMDKSDMDTAEYSFDFSSSPSRKHVDVLKNNEKVGSTNNYDHQSSKNSPNKNTSHDSQHQSSRGSVSISDVADLISDKSSSISNQINNDKTINRSRLSSRSYTRKKSDSYKSKVFSDDSGDFSESPVASLSNLSLDIHSD